MGHKTTSGNARNSSVIVVCSARLGVEMFQDMTLMAVFLNISSLNYTYIDKALLFCVCIFRGAFMILLAA